jgi:nitrous oxidase accessory protein NosD
MLFLCTGARLAKNIIAETDAEIHGYTNVFEALMQQFRDRAVRDTALGVHELG